MGNGQKLLGKNLMYAASAMGEKSAAFSIVANAIRSGRTADPEIRGPLQQVKLLANKENDPQAMTLLAQVLYSQRAESEALEWFTRATVGGDLDFHGAGEALVAKGRILQSRGFTKGATDAFKQAALELEYPPAYFHLSQMEPAGSKDHEVYLLKAAMSGVLEACHNLGALELSKIEKRAETPTSIKDYGMAWEWFQVAAADGFRLSMLNLALMYSVVGQEEEALRWEKRADEAGVSQQLQL